MEKATQSTQFQQRVLTLNWRGLYIKKDPALLEDGQFSVSTNVQSIVEGQLTTRYGTRVITNSSTWGSRASSVELIHSINKLRGSGNKQYFYVGSVDAAANTNFLWRLFYSSNGAIPNPGTPLPGTVIAFNTVSDSTVPYTQQRWSAVRYNAGSVGTPYMFFATPNKMLKDTGVFASNNAGCGDGTFDGTVIQKWGIINPVNPALPSLDAITILPVTVVVPGSGRLNTTIGSTPGSVVVNEAIPTIAGPLPGLIIITPSGSTDMETITNGVLLVIAGSVEVIAQNCTSTTFSCYWPNNSLPALSATITSGIDSLTCAITPGTVNTYSLSPSGLFSAAFDGTPGTQIVDGGTLEIHAYDTDDPVHISIGITDAADLQVIQFLVIVNTYPTPGTIATNYYEADIIPSTIQAQVSSTTAPLTSLATAAAQAQLGAQGIYNISSSTLTTAKPWLLNPVPSSYPIGGSPVWTEINIPKSLFMNVGLAGTSAEYSWGNVSGFQVIGVTNATSTTNPVVNIGSIYIAGGYGPNAVQNSANSPLQPYSYLYTYKNLSTGQESNPSPPLITNNYITPLRQRVILTLLSSTDNQISNATTSPSATATNQAICVYRQGGSYTDGLYRFIGYAANTTNSSGVGQFSTYLDSQSDDAILGADTVSYDNDAPVTSTLPVPLSVSFVSWTFGTGTPGVNTAQVAVLSGPSGALNTFIYPGSSIIVGPNTSAQETCYVGVVTSNKISVLLQNDHSSQAADGSVFITCDAVVGQPCNLALVALDSIFVAGDPNNPMALYKSKTGRPEAFPIVELDTGIADAINVGSPSNPIMNITEYNGQILCMNLESLFIVQVILGQMQSPLETPSHRGLYAQWAWCRVENEVWFLSYDGIYAWSGGAAIKKSEAVDPLFQGQSIGPYYAIDLSAIPGSAGPQPKDVITMAYSKQRVYVVYQDINGNYNRLRYDLVYDRWSVETGTYGGTIVPFVGGGISAQYVEQDVGFRYEPSVFGEIESNMMLGITTMPSYPSSTAPLAQLYLDGVGTSDGWYSSPSGGYAIPYAFTPAAFTFGQPSVEKQYSDTIFEIQNDSAGSVTVEAFYDFSTVVDSIDTFTITQPGSTLGRRRVVYTMQNGFGKEAYAMQLQYSGSSTIAPVFYTQTFNYFALDQIQVGRSFDWDSLNSPDDKRLYEVSIWYDASGVDGNVPSTITWTIDVITGIVGNQTVTQAVQNFVLPQLGGTFTGPSWTQITFPINDNIVTTQGIPNSIVKKVRLRPVLSSNTGNPFIVRNYQFNFEPLPPDTVYFTMWSSLSYDFDKIARNLQLDIDTAGVACSVALEADGATVETFSVTTNSNDRNRTIACSSNLEGRLWRLALTPGGGGKAQLFRASLDFIADVNGVLYMDTYEQDGGYIGYKAMKQGWFDYKAASPIVVTFIVDNGAVFYTVTLPAQSTRELVRFYFPAVNGGVLNKTKKFRIQISSATVFRLYANSTIEFILFATDQRLNFSLVQTNAEKQLPVAQMMSGAWSV